MPILCNYGDDCSLSLELFTVPEQSILDRCNGGQNALKFSQTQCGANLGGVGANENWKKGWEILQNGPADKVVVSGASDGQMRGNRSMRIVLKSTEYIQNEIWNYSRLDPINVCFLKSSTCLSQPSQKQKNCCIFFVKFTFSRWTLFQY